MNFNISLKNVLGIGALITASFLTTSCEDFLDRPTEDNYNTENFYGSD